MAVLLAVAALVLGFHPATSTSAAALADQCGAPVFRPDGERWRCTFADGFGGTRLDPGKWVPVTTAASGFRNGDECYLDTPQTVKVRDGGLRLTVRRVPERFTCHDPLRGAFRTRYQAGYVSTWQRFAQTYGRFEFRVRFPKATVSGLQSAVWLCCRAVHRCPRPWSSTTSACGADGT